MAWTPKTLKILRLSANLPCSPCLGVVGASLSYRERANSAARAREGLGWQVRSSAAEGARAHGAGTLHTFILQHEHTTGALGVTERTAAQEWTPGLEVRTTPVTFVIQTSQDNLPEAPESALSLTRNLL